MDGMYEQILETYENSCDQLDKNDLLAQTQEAFVGVLGIFAELGQYINMKAAKDIKRYKNLWESEMQNKEDLIRKENHYR